MWFTRGDRIGRIAPDGRVKEFALGLKNSARQIVTGPDGNLWFAGHLGSKPGSPYLGRFTRQGVDTSFGAGAAGVCSFYRIRR